jgi:hypothetical protein
MEYPMRKCLHILILLFFFLFPVLPNLSISATRGIQVIDRQGQSLYLYKDYHAMVVGVSRYEKWPDLPNAVKDAKEVAAGLKKSGFTVKLALDPTSRELRKILSDLVYEMGRENKRALLFYFAGHGETLELADGTALGYIVPSDCPLKSKDPVGFDSKAISMKDIEVLALKIKSRHLIMLFDSCFSGSLFNMVRAAPVNISEKSALPVRQFITAGAAGEQVPDRSVFKVVFLQAITGDADLNKDGYVTGSELGMHIQQKVVNYSRGAQHPQYGKINNPKLDRGDFIFIPPKVPEAKITGQSAAQETDDRIASIPQRVKIMHDVLKRGHGEFVIDDFEDRDLWSIHFNEKWKYRVKGPAKLKLLADPSQGANGTACSMKIEYTLGFKSAATVRLGGTPPYEEVVIEDHKKIAYDLSRFNKITFYLKGEKAQSFFSTPNRIYTNLICYCENARSRYGKLAQYYNSAKIVPYQTWKKIDIPFDDFVPTTWTHSNVSNYPPKPDLGHVIQILFMFSSFEGDGGQPDSNTVWIDEITLH